MDQSLTPDDPMADIFPTTHWTLVLQVRQADEDRCIAALEALCAMYWKPVFKFMQQNSKSDHDAEDLTQGFFAELLSKNFFKKVERPHVPFRAFLQAAAGNYVCNQLRKQQTIKRGGHISFLPFDQDFHLSAEEAFIEPSCVDGFDRHWAQAVLEQTLGLVRQDYEIKGNLALFDTLKATLQPGLVVNAELLAESHDMSAGALRIALHRFRKAFRRTLESVVAKTVADHSEIKDEIRHLLRALDHG